MCDYSLVVVKRDGSREKIMESVEEVVREGDLYVAKNIFGEKKSLSGWMERFDSSNNEIVFVEN